MSSKALKLKLADPETDARAEDVGRRVLEAFARGRQTAIDEAQARSRRWASLIIPLALLDASEGNGSRGRPKRIAQRLHGRLSACQVWRILRSLRSLEGAKIGSVRSG